MSYRDREPMVYYTGVACPYCKVTADEQCRTTGGNLYPFCHRQRKQAAVKAQLELRGGRPRARRPHARARSV